MIRSLILMTVISFLLFSCGEDNSSPTGPGGNNNTGLKATFSSIQVNVFDVSCAVSGCHDIATQRAGLNLSSGSAYNELVNASSTTSGLKRVDPGNSNNSWLVKRITGDGTGQMPPGGSLSSAKIDSIRSWIDSGALNN